MIVTNIVEQLVSIFVVVILPISIVYIVHRTRMNRDKLRTQILLKALESGREIDTEKLSEALRDVNKGNKRTDSARETRNRRLLLGCIGTIGGILAFIAAALLDRVQEATMTKQLIIISAVLLTIGISFLVVYFVTR